MSQVSAYTILPPDVEGGSERAMKSPKRIPDSEVVARLERIEMLLAAIAKAQMRPALAEISKDHKTKQIYKLIGKHPGQDIAKKVGVSGATVSRALKNMESLGLIVKEGSQFRRLF